MGCWLRDWIEKLGRRTHKWVGNGGLGAKVGRGWPKVYVHRMEGYYGFGML